MLPAAPRLAYLRLWLLASGLWFPGLRGAGTDSRKQQKSHQKPRAPPALRPPKRSITWIEPIADSSCDPADEWPWFIDPSLQTYPPQPLLDSDSAWVLARAVAELAVIRCPALGLADALADLHASMSLLRQGQAFLPNVVADARAQDRTWTEIAAQLGTSAAAAQRRYRHK